MTAEQHANMFTDQIVKALTGYLDRFISLEELANQKKKTEKVRAFLADSDLLRQTLTLAIYKVKNNLYTTPPLLSQLELSYGCILGYWEGILKKES